MDNLTVFVLGAGASAPYGLPLGDRLADRVAEKVVQIGIGRAEARDTYISAAHARVAMAEDKQKARELSNRILRSRTETIDAFIADAPEDEFELLKDAMIDVLWDKEDYVAERPERPEKGGDWIAWLYNNRLKREPDAFVHDKSVFVSFNYDRLPRLLISIMMANRYKRDIMECWETVGKDVTAEDGTLYDRFTHVHGSISIDPVPNANEPFLNCRDSQMKLEAASAGINIPGVASQADLPDKEYLTGLWKRAKRIFFLGFGYHQSLLDELFFDADLVNTVLFNGTRVSGTAFEFTNLQRAAVTTRLGTNFVLGDDKHDNLVFLQNRLYDDD